MVPNIVAAFMICGHSALPDARSECRAVSSEDVVAEVVSVVEHVELHERYIRCCIAVIRRTGAPPVVKHARMCCASVNVIRKIYQEHTEMQINGFAACTLRQHAAACHSRVSAVSHSAPHLVGTLELTTCAPVW